MGASDREFRHAAVAAAEAAGVPRGLAVASYEAFEQALFEELLTYRSVRFPNLFRLEVRHIRRASHNPGTGMPAPARDSFVRLAARMRDKLKLALYQSLDADVR